MMGFLVFVLTVVLGILALVGGLQWIDARDSRRVGKPVASPAQVDRVESALAGLETRLEALEEQQRFLERLLAERPDRPALPGRADRSEEEVRSILFDTDREEEER